MSTDSIKLSFVDLFIRESKSMNIKDDNVSKIKEEIKQLNEWIKNDGKHGNITKQEYISRICYLQNRVGLLSKRLQNDTSNLLKFKTKVEQFSKAIKSLKDFKMYQKELRNNNTVLVTELKPITFEYARNSNDELLSKSIIIDIRDNDEIKLIELKGNDWINLKTKYILKTKNVDDLSKLFENKGKYLDDYEIFYFVCKDGKQSKIIVNHLSKFINFNKTLVTLDGGVLSYASVLPNAVNKQTLNKLFNEMRETGILADNEA